MTTLSMHNVTVSPRAEVLIDDATAHFVLGGIHAVVGRSGAGKSVLLKAATGLLPMARGAVSLGALHADAHDDDAFSRLRADVVFVHQDPALLDDRSVEENVRFAATRRLEKSLVDERTAHVLTQLDLLHVRKKLPREVSPGRLRRVALARALVLEPKVLIVDEPTTGIDPVAARDVDGALLDVHQRGTTIIVVTHDRRSIATLKPTLTLVDEKTVRFQGAFADARSHGPPMLLRLLFGVENGANLDESPP